MTRDEALEIGQELCKKLDARAGEIEKCEQYYDGKHQLRFATRKFREAFGSLFREFANNWCGVVVDATTERLRIEGFRIPTPQKEQEREEAALEEEELRQAHTAMAMQTTATGSAVVGGPAAAGGSAVAGSAVAGGPPPTGSASPRPTAAPPTGSAAAPSKKEEKEEEPKNPAEVKQKERNEIAAQGMAGPVQDAMGAALMETPSQMMSAQQRVLGDDNTGDEEAWKIWQKNNLDLYSDIAHETALITGHAYILISPQDDGSTDEPVVTVEHPLEMVTRHAAGDPKKVTAAAKRWYDEETEHAYLTIYLKDSVWKFQSMGKVKKLGKRITWVGRDEVEERMDNPFPDEKVPVVPLINRQKLNGRGRSEIADVIPIQDAVNKLTNDMLIASEFAAFRQRILTGMEVPEDEKGDIIPDFDLKSAVNRLMIVKDANVGVHEFGVTDLQQYVKAIEHLRDSLAAITRTPPQYLIGAVVNVSGEALKAAESGHVQKSKRKCRFFGESWEEAIRLAFLLMGDTERAESYSAETIWANPEVMTEAALADSLAKYKILGVPTVALWERMGASQTEIQRWLQLTRSEPPPLEGVAAALGSMVRASQFEGV